LTGWSPTADPDIPQKDIQLAFYSDAIYIIVGLGDYHRPEARAYTIVDGEVREAEIEILS
jgi:hypothetical protein